MSTLQPQGPPKSGHTNHTEKHPHPQGPTPTNKAPSTPRIYQRLEHMENKHPHIYQCIPPQHTNARIGQRYAEAAHTVALSCTPTAHEVVSELRVSAQFSFSWLCWPSRMHIYGSVGPL